MRFMTVVSSLLLAATVYGQSIMTPVFVHKDGEASAIGYTGTEKDIAVDGTAQQSVGWIVFQTGGVDFSKVASAKLTLYVKSLSAPGTLGIYPLTAAVSAPENNLPLASVPVGSAAAATVSLGTADVEKMVQVDLTALLKAGAFHGVALKSGDGLIAGFDSKEGRLAPVILLTHNIESAAAKWHSGTIAPAAGLGKDGDYYLNTATGAVSAKSGGAWAVTMNVVGDTGPAGPKGDKGNPGTSSWVDGTGIVQTTAKVGVGKAPAEELDVSGTVKSDTVLAAVMRYSTPRTGYFSIGGEAFTPRTNVDYSKGFGMGGAYSIGSENPGLVAPVNLPHGAIIQNFKVFFYDNSATDFLTVYFNRFQLNGAYSYVAPAITSTTVTGYGSVTSNASSGSETVDNQTYSYSILATGTWDSNNLIIRGVVITYTVNQPE